MVAAATAALPNAGQRAGFYEAKIKTARFYFTKLLPQVNALTIAILRGPSR